MKLLVLFLTASVSFGQNPQAGRAEKKWAFCYPIASVKLKHIAKKCNLIYEEISKNSVLDNYKSGGNLDAFRHCFYMAAFAQKIKTKKLRRLGQLHEAENYNEFLNSKREFGELPDSLSSVMDLHNNEIGFKLGKDNKKLSLIELSKMVIVEIKNGKLLKMKRDVLGNYLTCEGIQIETEKYNKKWNIPKCLVPTHQN